MPADLTAAWLKDAGHSRIHSDDHSRCDGQRSSSLRRGSRHHDARVGPRGRAPDLSLRGRGRAGAGVVWHASRRRVLQRRRRRVVASGRAGRPPHHRHFGESGRRGCGAGRDGAERSVAIGRCRRHVATHEQAGRAAVVDGVVIPAAARHASRALDRMPSAAAWPAVGCRGGRCAHYDEGWRRTWQDRVPGGPYDTHELSIHPQTPDTLRVAACEGYCESHDGGATYPSAPDHLRGLALPGSG